MVLEWMGEDFLEFIELHQIIIPLDFDKTVNRLQNTTWYNSDRIQLCIGKTIECDGNNIIVISPLTYSELMNFGKRCKFILHELYHLVNRKHFKIPEYIHTAESRYTNTIAIMHDEYSANLFANKMLGKLEKFEIFGDVEADVAAEYRGFISSLQDEKQYYLPLKNEYQDWLEHGDTGKMLTNIYQYIDAAIKDITYCYSFADSFESIKEDFLKRESVFLNDDTENIFNFFRQWHAAEELEIDFGKGIEAIKLFFASCFGINFSDTPQGERFDLVPF